MYFSPMTTSDFFMGLNLILSGNLSTGNLLVMSDNEAPKNISKEHISSKKRVGTLRGRPVIALTTTGGLHMVVCAKTGGGSLETLGVGPHAAVARHIARMKEPELEFSDLCKHDYVDPQYFQDLLPQWLEVTDKFRNR